MDGKEEMSLRGDEETSDGKMQPGSQECCSKLDQYATKNVLVISLGFLLLFTAYDGLQFLQSSIHTEDGLGLASLSVIYGTYAAATISGLGPVLINKISHKWTMVASMIAYLLWMLMNGHATWYTMIPSAALVGLGAGCLWVAQAAYFTITATNVASSSGERMEIIIHRYFGIFLFMYSSGALIGPAISSAILHDNDNNTSVYNSSYTSALWSKCGTRDCPGNQLNETAIEPQDPQKVWLLVGVYGGCGLLAVISLALTLDNVNKPTETFSIANIWKTLFSVVRQHRDWRQLLLIPLFLQQGWAHSFIYGEFFRSFGSCLFGVWMVGVLTLPFGLGQSVMSLAAGGLVKYAGGLVMIIAALVGELAVLITLLCWSGGGGQYVVYTLSCILGVTDGIKRNIIYGTVSRVFRHNSEAAFCVANFWDSLAWIISFAYSKYLCTSTKIWVLLTITLLAAFSFIIFEKSRCIKTKYGTVAQDEPGTNVERDQGNLSL